MEWFLAVNADLSEWFWGYRQFLVASWIAVLLVIYGGDLNSAVRRVMQPYHFMLRMAVFVLLCTFGYGAIAVYGQLALSFGLLHIDQRWGAGVVITVFGVLSVLAERKKQA